MVVKNDTLMTDYYELTMANGYYESGMKDLIAYFDVFYRRTPDNGGFAICCGLDTVIRYVNAFHFEAEELAFLRAKKIFSEGFLDYLAHFKFTGDIWAAKEGTPIFPGEPIMTVRAPAIQAQILETYVLAALNHESLIATKTNRIVRAASPRPVSEFGARRAHGAEAATLGARAAFIAGCGSTSNTLTDYLYGATASGTMAHSWVQMFPTEYDAFKRYCELYPDSALLLVDTYNVLKEGVPNAIRAFNEVLAPLGKRPLGIRIDSGDVAYLTKKARKALDDGGYPDAKIFISNSLDEYLIRDIISQGAKIDAFGVGERLITSSSSPVFDGVYKLCAVEENGVVIPKIKVSESVPKITTPGFKMVWRFFDDANDKCFADLIALRDEGRPEGAYELFDPEATWKRQTVTAYHVEPLLVPIYQGGKQVYLSPSTREIKDYCATQVGRLWDEVKRFENPHNYYIDLSQKLYDLKQKMIKDSQK